MSQDVKNYQQSLIDNAITGSNVAISKMGKKLFTPLLTPRRRVTWRSRMKLFSQYGQCRNHNDRINNDTKRKRSNKFYDPVSKYIPYFKDLKCEKEI